MIVSANWKPSYKYTMIGFVEFIVLMVIFWIILAYDATDTFPFHNDCLSTDKTSDECYCEQFSDTTLVKQPVNTYASLSFVPIGFGILSTLTKGVSAQNLMRSSTWFPATYAFIVIFMGIGSMCLHASMSGVGEFLDYLSILLWLGYAIAFEILRLAPLKPVVGTAICIFLVASTALIQELTWKVILITTLLSVLVSLETIIFYRVCNTVSSVKCLQTFAPLGLAIAVFGVAVTIRIFSRTGGVMCFPESWMQGHAVWHFLCALVTGLVYLYALYAIDPPKFRVPHYQFLKPFYSEEDDQDDYAMTNDVGDA